MGEHSTAGALAGGGCPRLAPLCFPQLHIVHMNVNYRTLAEAKGHPNGLAVLGFFFQVGLWGLTLLAERDPSGNRLLTVWPGKGSRGHLEAVRQGRLCRCQEVLGSFGRERCPTGTDCPTGLV